MRRLPEMGTVLLAAAVGAAAISRLRGVRPGRPPADPAVDGAIAERVQAHLRHRFDAGAEDFGIQVHRGRVVLRGQAADLAELERLQAEIERLEGVTGVDNLLRLRVGSAALLHGGPQEVRAWLS